MLKQVVICAFICIAFFSTACAQTLWVDIEGIRNKKGVLQLGIFENQDQFSSEVPAINKEIKKTDVENGKISLALNLKAGEYGISILDDEDHSGDVTFKFLVYPVEGVGFSGYQLSGLKKPKFSDFSFQLVENEMRVKIKMKYFN